MTDVIGGHVDLFMSSMTQALPLIRGGQMRGLVVTSAARSEAAPDVPIPWRGPPELRSTQLHRVRVRRQRSHRFGVRLSCLVLGRIGGL